MCNKPFHSSSQENSVSIADYIRYGSRDMGNINNYKYFFCIKKFLKKFTYLMSRVLASFLHMPPTLSPCPLQQTTRKS